MEFSDSLPCMTYSKTELFCEKWNMGIYVPVYWGRDDDFSVGAD